MTGKLSALTLILFLALPAVWGAEKKTSATDGIAVGLGGGAGLFHAYAVNNSELTWDPGLSINFGLIFEKMFTNRLGLHSGLWFQHGKVWFKSPDAGFLVDKAYVEMSILQIPIDCIIAFNAGFFTFDILAGLSLSQVIESNMKIKEPAATNIDFLHAMNYFQLALDLGFNLKFRVGRFTDLFIGVKSHAYLLPTMQDERGDKDNFSYDLQASAGIMFHMSIFPF